MKYNDKKKYQIALRRLYATNTPSKRIIELLGTDKETFISHVDKFLLDGMTKDNFGQVWSLDHIVPVDVFNFEDEEELKLCYNFNNIMPMFMNDNRVKGASIHFSLEKLRHMAHASGDTKVYINKLIQRCEQVIEEVYMKYLI
jgi:hypothetical protein